MAFIVITFGVSAATSTVSRSSGIASAALGALAAGVLVILVGALVRIPLAKVPENTLKFVVGIMLTTFGTFWLGEGFGVAWPLADVFLLILAAIYLGASFLLTVWLKHLPGRVFLAHCLAQMGETATASASDRESISSHDRANTGG